MFDILLDRMWHNDVKKWFWWREYNVKLEPRTNNLLDVIFT